MATGSEKICKWFVENPWGAHLLPSAGRCDCSWCGSSPLCKCYSIEDITVLCEHCSLQAAYVKKSCRLPEPPLPKVVMPSEIGCYVSGMPTDVGDGVWAWTSLAERAYGCRCNAHIGMFAANPNYRPTGPPGKPCASCWVSAYFKPLQEGHEAVRHFLLPEEHAEHVSLAEMEQAIDIVAGVKNLDCWDNPLPAFFPADWRERTVANMQKRRNRIQVALEEKIRQETTLPLPIEEQIWAGGGGPGVCRPSEADMRSWQAMRAPITGVTVSYSVIDLAGKAGISQEEAEAVLAHLKPGDGHRTNVLLAQQVFSRFAQNNNITVTGAILTLKGFAEGR